MIDMNALWTAVIEVETGGLADRAHAVGDGGKALGIAQIWTVVVDDANGWMGRKDGSAPFCYEDRLDPVKSKAIFMAYLERWGANYRKKTGAAPGFEALERIWNGGPAGYRKRSTLGYWAGVQKVLDRMGVAE